MAVHKIIIFIFPLLLFCVNIGYNQTTIDFDDNSKWTAGSGTLTSYQTDHTYTDGLFSATGGPALRQNVITQDGYPAAQGTYSWRIQNDSTAEWIITISSGGVGNFSMDIRRWDNSPSPDFNLDYSVDGGSNWTNINVINNTTLSNSSDWTTFNGTINSSNSNIKIRLKANGTTERIMVDNFVWYPYSSSPLLTVTPTTLTGFNYIVGNGPSASQSYSLSGSNLTGAPGNITVTAPTDYEVSLDNSSFSSSVSVPYASSTLSATTIYVRLKAGLTAGNYNNENVSNAGGGATTVYVNCSGTVNEPQLNSSTSSLTGFAYVVGSGPSASQSFDVSGVYLTPASGNVNVTAPANYQVSTDNTNFFNSVTLPYNSNTLNATTIYVRLISGLPVGNYTGNITISGGNASDIYVSLNGDVVNPPTAFEAGDFAILAINSNISCLPGYSSGDDEISFMTFRDINNGDSFYMTDNGYERENAGQWGNTEGVLLATRTGGLIPAGTVITFRFRDDGVGVYEAISPDVNWNIVEVHTTGTHLILHSGGDQIYFMQGGTWDYGTPGNHDATYTPGEYLYAFNTNSSWTSFGHSTQESGLIPGMECFNLMPSVATDYVEYIGPTTATTKRIWISRLNDPANWTNRIDCNTFYANNIHYGQVYSINPGGYSPGYWVGISDNNWFNCKNWQNLEIPDSTVDVVIPDVFFTYNPTIGAPPTSPIAYTSAECKDIDIQNNRTLVMNDPDSRLDVYGDINVDGTLNASSGTIYIMDNNSILNSPSSITFNNLNINKNNSSNTFTINNNIEVDSVLTLTNGIINTGANRVTINYTNSGSITGHSTNSFINGNLRRYVASTGSYDFPVGTSSNYELANITLNSSSGLSYLDAKFTAPHTTPINISAQGLTVNGTPLIELLDYGFWTITPDAGTYDYDVTLVSRGHTNSGTVAAEHAVIKRPNALSNWISTGTHNNTDQSMGAGWVSATRRNLTDFSDFAIAKSNNLVLPVELIEFYAIYNKNHFVDINWTTASEYNNDYYILEKSYNAKDFIDFELVYGQNNSNSISNYSVRDYQPENNIIYYRLKQYDLNGDISYSNIISVNINNNSNELIYLTESQILLAHNVTDNNVLRIIDQNGNIVFNKVLDKGDFKIQLNLLNLHSGIYIAYLTNIQSIISEKIFIKK